MKKFLLVPIFLAAFAFSSAAEMQGAPQIVKDPKQAFVTGSIVVKGESAAPTNKSFAQKRIMALRGAKAVALREALEVVKGVAVSGETIVREAITESDVIRTTVEGLVNGAQVIKEEYDPNLELAVVYISVPMNGPNGIIGSLMPQLVPIIPQQQFQPYQYQPPADAPPAKDFDGLIIDVREHPFKPALINRVLSKNGEIIYDPAKVAQNILVERGAAEYTNDVGKAKALLGERGSSNPAVIRAGGIVRYTDVELEPADAGVIFTSNQTANYLESAKVVFVLK